MPCESLFERTSRTRFPSALLRASAHRLHFVAPKYRVQRIAQLVAEHRQKFIFGAAVSFRGFTSQTLRFQEFLALLPGTLLAGDVAGNSRGADDPSAAAS